MDENQAKLDYRDPEWVADQLGIDKNTVYKYLQDGAYHPADLKPNEFNNPSQRWSLLMTLRYEF